MDWINMLGTIAFGAALILAVIALVDILFLKPTPRTRKAQVPATATSAHASLIKGMRRR
jgi:hypothetical protein